MVPMPNPEMIEVENVNTPGVRTRVNAEKYRAAREALLKALPKKTPGLTQSEMGLAILPHLPERLFPGGAKSLWWMKTVQLDLEAKGLVRRDPKTKPLRWWRT